MLERIQIFAGGNLDAWAEADIREDDFLIGVDRGAWYLISRGFSPHLAIGDFDSVTSHELARIRQASKQWISCDPVMKDWTDTEMALRWALEHKPHQIDMYGVTGTRFDHTLANIHLLTLALDAGVPCRIIDAHNRLSITAGSSQVTVTQSPFTHVSLLPLSLETSGIYLEGFQYPLRNATLTMGQSLGISNVLMEEKGTVTVGSGLLLIVESRD